MIVSQNRNLTVAAGVWPGAEGREESRGRAGGAGRVCSAACLIHLITCRSGIPVDPARPAAVCTSTCVCVCNGDYVTTVQCSTDKGDHHRHITESQNHSIRHHIPYTTTQTCLRPETWSVDKGQSGIGTEHRRGPVWLEMFGSPRWRRSRHPVTLRSY